MGDVGEFGWRAPGDNKNHLIRNQIDFIMITDIFGILLTYVKTYPDADATIWLLSIMIFKLKRVFKRSEN